jgi:hypothetical protein
MPSGTTLIWTRNFCANFARFFLRKRIAGAALANVRHDASERKFPTKDRRITRELDQRFCMGDVW